ncbi:MAG: GntR family transcriptional regulator [Chitinivibrionales bacterium]|nr:GntR family transcriptional regulator [Chitinivibrionales bacterium]
MHRKSPALGRAVAFLRARIAGNEGERLPGLRRLCGDAGVSLVTMHKAVAVLEREGLVRAVRGRGIEVVGVNAVPESVIQPDSGPKWRRLCDTLERDIRRGVYPPDSLLPSPKALRLELGVCHETLARALGRLVSAGVLQRHKRTYRVCTLGRVRRGSTVLLILQGEGNGVPGEPTARTQENLRSLEQQCSRLGLTLSLLVYHNASRTLRSSEGAEVSIRAQCAEGAVLGALLWTIGIGPDHVRGILRQQRDVAIPVAVLDENGSYAVADMPSRRFRLFSMANSPVSGMVLGRYLLRLGHRRIAYLSPVHNPQWSRNRLAGLRASARSLPGTHVAAFTHDLRFPTTSIRSPSRILERSLRMPTGTATRELELVMAAVRRNDAALSAEVRNQAFAHSFVPLFTEALREPGLTAWVAATDKVALAAVDFLREHGVRVPDDISVAGFDDGLDAYLRKLTSHNFNAPAVMHAMLAHLLERPGRGVAAGQHEPEEIEGFVSERLTTATAASPPPHASM